VAVHAAALAWGKLTRVLNRRSADPSEVIMSSPVRSEEGRDGVLQSAKRSFQLCHLLNKRS
jgi:hypothetical protein